MILKNYIYVKNKAGVGIPGKTVVCYPHGTTANGITATDLGFGDYQLLINSATTPLSIAKTYDIYVDNIMKYSGIVLGDWMWLIEGYEIAADTAVLFSDLTTRTMDHVPAVMPSNVIVAVERNYTDRLGMIDNITTTGFDLKLSVAGDPTGKYDLRVYLA